MSEINQSLDRGLQVLKVIDLSTEPLGVREIARQLDLGATITQRLVTTLLARDFIEQADDTRRYKIGHGSVSLGMSSQHGDRLVEASHSRLLHLAEHHGLNGFLGVINGNRAIYVLCVPSRGRIVLRVDTGEAMPLHTTALGRVLLAAVGDERAYRLLAATTLEQITPKSITDPSAIVQQLSEIRHLGYAHVSEENIPGVISIAAPVRNVSGEVVAGISVAYTINTSASDFREIAELIVATAAEVSRELGCPDTRMNNWSSAR